MDDLWEAIDAATGLSLAAARDAELAALVELIEGELALRPCAELEFVAGYCEYARPARKVLQSVRDNSERHLRAALELDREHERARLYLGHLFFDEEDFVAAQRWLESVCGELDSSLEAKRRELLVVCALELEGPEAGLGAFRDFRAWCADLPAVDLLPRELLHAASRTGVPALLRDEIASFAEAVEVRLQTELTE